MSERTDKSAAAASEHNGLTLDDDESHELQEVFSTIFPQYLIPLEELIGQLLEGKASPEMIEGLRGAVSPLVSAAESIGVESLRSMLQEFQNVVEKVGRDAQLDEASRNNVIDIFYRLKETVHGLGTTQPPRQGTPGDFVKRLSAIEGVGPAQVQQMLAAGISSAEQVRNAAVDEIAAVTGFGEALARRIYEAFGGARGKTACMDAPGSGTGAPPGEPSRPHELEARLALVSLVRERIRLSDSVRREAAALERARANAEQLRRAVALLHDRVRQGCDELAHEKDLARRAELEIEELRAEIERIEKTTSRTAERGANSDIEGLHARITELKRRLETRFRWV